MVEHFIGVMLTNLANEIKVKPGKSPWNRIKSRRIHESPWNPMKQPTRIAFPQRTGAVVDSIDRLSGPEKPQDPRAGTGTAAPRGFQNDVDGGHHKVLAVNRCKAAKSYAWDYFMMFVTFVIGYNML